MFGIQILDSTVSDFAAALRGLRKRPTYLVIAAGTLSLGVGIATIVFSVIDSIALQSPLYTNPERLAMLYERSLVDPELDRFPVTPATFLDWRAMSRSYVDLAAYDYASAVFNGERSAERLAGVTITGNGFELLAARPQLGRTITTDDVDNDMRVVVLSQGIWRRAFGSDASIIGADILLDGEPTTVVGVMPAGFRFRTTARSTFGARSASALKPRTTGAPRPSSSSDDCVTV